MTDLERVRQAIRNGERAMIQLNWAADTWGCEADIDAHLKEDAERDELLKAKGEVIEAAERRLVLLSRERTSRLLDTESDPERKRKLEIRMTGLVRAIGEAEPGEREFCLAAIDEWLDYQMDLQDQRDTLLAALREMRDKAVNRLTEDSPMLLIDMRDIDAILAEVEEEK